MTSPIKPLMTLKLKLFIFCRDFTYRVPYCDANACPVACWKKLSPTTIAVRFRLNFENSSLKWPCSGSLCNPFWIDANSSSISSEVNAPSRSFCKLIRASSMRPWMRSHRGDCLRLAFWEIKKDGEFRSTHLWNKPYEGCYYGGNDEEKPQRYPPRTVIVYLASPIAHPANDHPSELKSSVSITYLFILYKILALTTMVNWYVPTMKPRIWVGAISDWKTGTTESSMPIYMSGYVRSDSIGEVQQTHSSRSWRLIFDHWIET